MLKAWTKAPKSLIMHTSLANLWSLVPVGLLVASALSCMKGPGFMQQGPKEAEEPAATKTEELKKFLVQTVDAGAGAVVGNLTASSGDIQVIQASGDSDIAGSLAEFPPGSLAVDTSITLGPGVSIATPSNLNQLALDPEIVASAPSVTISSSVALDTSSGFTMQIPVPSGSGLSLQDALANLVVIYKIKKVADNGDFSGLLTRGHLEIAGGYVRFTTTFFGTFQAIITKKLVEETKEVAVKAEPKFKKTFYTKGFATATLGDDTPRSEGYLALFHSLTPATVKADADSKLSTGLMIKRSQEVTEQ